MSNEIITAVAGAGKTSLIIARCKQSTQKRKLVITYTFASQDEIRTKLSRLGLTENEVEVRGWFSFLYSKWIRPYLSDVFPDAEVRGIDVSGIRPPMFSVEEQRYFTNSKRVYSCEAAHLAFLIDKESHGAAVNRLVEIYDSIYIDESQDFVGWDLELFTLLFASPIDVVMVGDPRQAIVATDSQAKKNSKYKGIEIMNWFSLQGKRRNVILNVMNITHRCSKQICDVANSVFENSGFGFADMDSEIIQERITADNGRIQEVWTVSPENATTYFTRMKPLVMCWNVTMGRKLNLKGLPYTTFGDAKGTECDNVLIAPTDDMIKALNCPANSNLAKQTRSKLYVGITRARKQLAFIADPKELTAFPQWLP
jgi:superfamily I DNA/RNA helicase